MTEELNTHLPKHVAIIMDGNGRWASRKGKPRVFGHKQGVESVRSVVTTAGNLGIKVLTLFAFSEENWGRPNGEVNFIMNLLNTYIKKERKSLNEKNVVFRTIGNLSKLPDSTRALIEETKEMLSKNTGMILNIALSYGGRQEITNACKSIANAVKAGELDVEDIRPELFEKFLDTSDLPAPDLLIRSSGEQRISNFLLWQLAYTELYFTDVLWPDFDGAEFENALEAYSGRDRRFGLVGKIDKLPKIESFPTILQ